MIRKAIERPEKRQEQPKKAVGVTRDRTAALEFLLKAYADAQDLGRPTQEFAVEVSDLRAACVPTSDLRWLIGMGYAAHLLEVTPRRGQKRKFVACRSLAFKGNSCLVLSDRGFDFATQPAEPASVPFANGHTFIAPAKPRWNARTRELWVGDVLVRRFRTRAYQQVKILTAFELGDWPEHLADPLGANKSEERTRTLHDAIRKLNRHQITSLIQFRGDGTGRGICWELVKATTK